MENAPVPHPNLGAQLPRENVEQEIDPSTDADMASREDMAARADRPSEEADLTEYDKDLADTFPASDVAIQP